MIMGISPLLSVTSTAGRTNIALSVIDRRTLELRTTQLLVGGLCLAQVWVKGPLTLIPQGPQEVGGSTAQRVV